MKLIGAGNHIHSSNSLKSRLRFSAIQSCLLLALLVFNHNSVRGQGSFDYWSSNPWITNGWSLTNILGPDYGQFTNFTFTPIGFPDSDNSYSITFESVSNYLGSLSLSLPSNWNNGLISSNDLRFVVMAWNATNSIVSSGGFGPLFPPLPPTMPNYQAPAAFATLLATHGYVGEPIELAAVGLKSDDPLARVEFYSYQVTTINLEPEDNTSAGGIQISLPPIYTTPLIIYAPLDTVTTPPFQTTWIPSTPGVYTIGARTVLASGLTYDLPGQTIRIDSANDNFAQAQELDPAMTETNIAFNTAWTSVESAEPLRRKAAPAQTLWWKWTPSRTIKMRFKAVRYSRGLPLEIFTGSELSNLHRLAHNNRSASVVGKTGMVELKVRAGRTYFIRVSEDAQTAMHGYANAYTANLILEPAANPLPGELDFSLIAAPVPRLNTVIPFGRVFRANGRTPLVGSQYCAQLYVGLTRSTLSPAGNPMSFFDESAINQMPSLRGLFSPDVVVLPEIPARRRVFAQIRVWDSTFGESMEDARANGSPVGFSRLVSVITGSEKSNPGKLFGIGSFKISKPQ